MLQALYIVLTITLIITLSSHLGLTEKIIGIIGLKGMMKEILTCVKCSSFWSLIFFLSLRNIAVEIVILMSFIGAYLAIWIELGFGFLSEIYDKLWQKLKLKQDQYQR